MASICLASNNGATVAPQKYQFHILGSKCLDRFVSRRSFSSSVYNCASFSSLKSQIPCNFRDRVFFVSKLKSFIDGQRRNTYTNLEREGFNDMRRRFKLRLRPTLRLFSRKLKRVSAQSIVNDIGVFLRKNLKRVILVTSISVALGLCYLVLKIMAIPSPKIVPYSDLVMNLQNGTVTRVLFEEGSRRIYFNTKTQNTKSVDAAKESLENGQLGITVDIGVSEGAFEAPQVEGVSVLRASMRKQASRLEWQYSTRKVDHDENFLLGLMRENGTEYSSAPQSVLMSVRSLLITILTLWVPLAPLMWVIYRQLYAANSSARKRRPSNKMVSFDDVEGVGSAKMELMEIVLCLQGAIKYKKLGARLPRGVLLVGPPGTGKTLLARAVAGEAGVPFFSVSASEFVELFVGRGAARIRDLFNMARKSAPSIIFIDELDAVGGKRGRSFNDERDQTLNQLLTEMDGFASDAKVVVIAATNRPEALDSALTRPGRFSRKVLVSEPDEDGRRKILGVHLRDIPMEEDKVLICSLVASLTSGFVGADLANIVNEAALLASRRGGEAVAREDIMEAIERAKYGIINNKQVHSSTLGKELGKLLDWMPSFMGRTGGLRRPLGYHTLS